jgi:hypothetical protein
VRVVPPGRVAETPLWYALPPALERRLGLHAAYAPVLLKSRKAKPVLAPKQARTTLPLTRPPGNSSVVRRRRHTMRYSFQPLFSTIHDTVHPTTDL